MAQTDAVVGKVLDALAAAGAAENTLVVFTSDNGPEVTGEVDRYAAEPERVKDLAALLARYVANGRSTPGPKQANDGAVVWDKRPR